MDAEDGLFGFDSVADLDEGFDADGGVDGVAFGFAAAAEFDDLEADGFGVDGFDPAGFALVGEFVDLGGDLPVFVVENFSRSVLGGDPLLHFHEGGTGFDCEGGVGEDAAVFEGDLGEVDAEVAESSGFLTAEDADGFFDFEGVSGGST